jgi:hypothetical protein
MCVAAAGCGAAHRRSGSPHGTALSRPPLFGGQHTMAAGHPRLWGCWYPARKCKIYVWQAFRRRTTLGSDGAGAQGRRMHGAFPADGEGLGRGRGALQVLPTRREAAATAGGSRARSMQARAAGSEGELDLLSALGLTAGEGASAVADLLADPTFDSTRACPAPLPVSRRHAGGRRPAKQRPGRPRGEGFPHASPRSPHAQALPRCTSQWIPEAQLSPRWSSIANACRRRLLQKNKWAPLLGLKAGPTAG